MHISEKLAEAKKAGKVTFSFEFFPPKTAQGIQNLYDRKFQAAPLRNVNNF
jgi:methylenetetrahydrofolate reductase (NADPH)